MENIIREFLTASIKGKLNYFDFEEAYDEFRPYLEYKLNQHGLLSFDEYVDQMEEFGQDTECLEQFAICTDYINFTAEDVLDAIHKAKYEALRYEFTDMFSELIELSNELEYTTNNTLEQNIILFDKCIHSQHQSGDILEDVDIEAIKEDIEQDFKDGIL